MDLLSTKSFLSLIEVLPGYYDLVGRFDFPKLDVFSISEFMDYICREQSVRLSTYRGSNSPKIPFIKFFEDF